MKKGEAPYAGRNKRWLTRIEVFRWILDRGFPRRLPHEAPNASEFRIVAERALKISYAVEGAKSKFGGQHAATALAAIDKAMKKGLLRTKTLRSGSTDHVCFHAEDVRKCWPSPSRPGSGRPKRELLQRRELFSLTSKYSLSPHKISREKAGLGAISNTRFQILRRAARVAAKRGALADLQAGLISREVFNERLKNIKSQK